MVASLLILLVAAATPASPPRCAGTGLPTMVARYAALTRAQDSRRIARLYGRSGVLIGPNGAPITGAGEIEAFLGGFAGFSVSADSMTIDRITPVPTGYRVEGRFAQQGTTPDKQTFDAHGQFAGDWACRRGGWRIDRLATSPDKDNSR